MFLFYFVEWSLHAVLLWLAMLALAVWMSHKAEITGWFGFLGELLFGWPFLGVLLALDYFGAPDWLRRTPQPAAPYYHDSLDL